MAEDRELFRNAMREMPDAAPYEPFYDPVRTDRDNLEREHVAALLPFLAAFAEGRAVWTWQEPRQTREGRWRRLVTFDMLIKPEALSLEYRTEPPSS